MGTQVPLPKGAHTPNFRPISVVAKWLDGSRFTWYGGRPRPRRHCARRGPSSPPQKWGTAPNFRLTFVVAKRLDGSRCHFNWYIRWSASAQKARKGHNPPNFRSMSIVAKRRPSQLLLSTCRSSLGCFKSFLSTVESSKYIL